MAKMQRLTSNLFLLISVIFMFIGNASAAVKSKPESLTRIRSEIIDIKRKSQTVEFVNNVIVERDDSSLLAGRMKVIYDKKQDENSTESSSIKRIDASENVRIFTDEFIATGEVGHYDPQRDFFVLEKKVTVNNGTSIASGDKFVYNLKTKKGNFVGKKTGDLGAENNSDKRAVVVIGNDVQDSKKQRKNPSDDKNSQR